MTVRARCSLCCRTCESESIVYTNARHVVHHIVAHARHVCARSAPSPPPADIYGIMKSAMCTRARARENIRSTTRTPTPCYILPYPRRTRPNVCGACLLRHTTTPPLWLRSFVCSFRGTGVPRGGAGDLLMRARTATQSVHANVCSSMRSFQFGNGRAREHA